MVRKSVVFFLGLSPIIPLTAHFAEGLIFIVGFWLFFAAFRAATVLIKWVNFGKYARILPSAGVLCTAALYVQIIGIIFPIIAIGLETYLYITAFSYVLVISIGIYDSHRYPLELPITYTLLLTMVSLLRELIVFGTVSLPARSGLLSITLFPGPLPFRFLGSSAGILILLGIALRLFRSMEDGTLLPFKTGTSQ